MKKTVWVIVLALLQSCGGFSHFLSTTCQNRRGTKSTRWQVTAESDGNGCKKVTFTDPDGRKGPEDLTDRFKYSVNALMGLYDPPDGKTDNEQNNKESFAISNALLNFPIEVEFVAVGEGEAFCSLCVEAMSPLLPREEGEAFDFDTVPRGKKYTKFKVRGEG